MLDELPRTLKRILKGIINKLTVFDEVANKAPKVPYSTILVK
jgi:hypothetical protein